MMLARQPEAKAYRDAEEIAVAALAYIAWDVSELNDFLFVTGLERETIRRAARTPQFLAGILDYVVDDPMVLRRVAAGIRATVEAVYVARRDLMPSVAVSTAHDPRDFGPGPLWLRCECCDRDVRQLDRRQHSHIPGRAIRVAVPRCGACGGGFDQPETWLDAAGREIDTSP